jgi:radical SAM superfamily enzyme YgiQ (UPF0313 family)
MKIALVNPSQKAAYGRLKAPVYPPLGLGYLASVLLGKGHRVDILDMEAGKMGMEDFRKWLSDERPGLVGFTCTTPLYHEVLKLSKIVKDEIQATCVAGGIHPSVLPEEMFRDGDIDIAVRGEGEETLLELVEILERGGRIEDCPGLTFRRNGGIINTLPRDLIKDLDLLPFPHRQPFHRVNYFYPDSRQSICFPVITSRGCSGQCTFCCSRCIFTHRFRYRRAENIVDEIAGLKERFGAKEIHIWDDNFTFIKRRVFEIKDELRRRRIEVNFAFPNGLRVDQVNKEILQALKEMGTYSISFGVESGSQKVLDRACKGIKIERVKEAFRMCRELGMETWAFFIIGLPGEDASTVKETIKLAKDISPDIAKFHVLKPFPGSSIYSELAAEQLIDDFNYEHFGIHTGPIHHLPGLSRTDIQRWQKAAYRSFYLRPAALLRQLFRLKSIYRLKTNLRVGVQLFREMISG